MNKPSSHTGPCLWVDDVREAPESWDLARTYEDALIMLDSKNYSTVSLDYYLSAETDKQAFNGYDILLWLKKRKDSGGYIPGTILAHSSSSRARDMMNEFIRKEFGSIGF